MRTARPLSIRGVLPSLVAALALAAAARGASLGGAIDLVDSARDRALGGTTAAVEDDATLLWKGPVAAARADRPEVTFGGQRGFIDDAAWHVSGSAPVGADWSLGGGAAYYDTGLIDLRAADGQVSRVRGQLDELALVNVAGAAFPWLSVGASAKVLHTQLLNQFTVTTAAADAGAAVRADENLTLGVAAENLGGRVTYAQESLTLPTAVRGGARIASVLDVSSGTAEPLRLAVATDAVWLPHDDALEWRFGLEALWGKLLAIRFGAALPDGRTPWQLTMGLGAALRSVRLDYAAHVAGTAQLPQSLSLTIPL